MSALRLALGCGLPALPAGALAHAPPEVVAVTWQGDGEPVLVSNRGLIFGEPGSEHFRLMCGEALHVNSGERPKIAHRADGSLLAATSGGLFLTRDQGCSWAAVPPLVDMFVPALVQQPGHPDTLVAATYGDGASALRITRDGGERWELLSALQDRDYTRSLLYAPGDASLMYASGIELISTPAPGQRHYAARSTDGGQRWERWDFPLAEDELDLTLLAVNPAEPRELVARASAATAGLPERLLRSDDGGETFSTLTSLLGIAAAAFSADGGSLWVASLEGLFRAGSERDAVARVGDAERLTCVGQDADGTLWACGRYTGLMSLHDGVGRSPRADGVFEPFMDYTDVTAPVACPAGSETADICAHWWSDFESEVFPGSAGDAGAQQDAALPAADAAEPLEPAGEDATAPSDASAEPTRGAKRASGCAVGQDRSAPALLLVLGLLALLSRARSRGIRGGERRPRVP